MGKKTGLRANDKTGQLQAEKMVEDGLGFFQALIENSLDAVVVVDKDGVIKYESQSIEHMLGYDSGTFIGKSPLDLVHPEDVSKASDALTRILEGKDITILEEVRVRHADGSWHCVEASGKYLLDDPSVQGIVVSFRDITQRKSAEEALKESEDKWRVLVQAAPERITMVGRDDLILYINRVTPGRTVDEVIGTNICDYTFPKDQATVRRVLKSVFQNKKAQKYEVRSVAPDGTQVWFENSAAPLERNGEVVAAILVSMDITARKRMEEELQRKEEYFRALIENSLDFIAVVGADGTIRYQSPFAAEILGYESAYRGARTSLELVHPDDLPKASEALAELIRKPGSMIQAEVRAKHKDGSWHTFEVAGRNLLDDPIVGGIVANFRDITERKQAEEELRMARDELETRVEERTLDLAQANEALRESGRRHRELVELLPLMVFEIDEKGDFTFTNRKAFATFGYTEGEIEKGFTSFQTLIPEDVDRARDNMKRALAGEKFGGNEYRALRKDGSTFPVLIFSSPITRNNKPVGLRGVVVDLTERKQMEEELRGSEKRFRSLIENASDVIVIIGSDGTIKYESPSVKRVLGYRPEELVSQHGFFGLHPDDLSSVTEEFARLMEDPGGILQTEIRYQHKDGYWLNIEATGYNLIDDSSIGGIVVNFRDVTERKQAEEALRQSEERHRSLIEHALDIIYVVSPDGTVASLNPAFETATGWSRSEWIGKQFAPIIHPDDLPLAMEGIRQASSDNAQAIREVRIVSKSGEYLTMEFRGTPLLENGEVTGYLGIGRDVTDRKLAEEVLRESEERFKAIAESVPSPLSIMRKTDGTIMYANELFGSAIGLSVDELIGRKVSDFYHNPTDRPFITDKMDRDEIVSGGELLGKRANGTPFHVIASVQLITFEGEQAYLGSFYDITERKQMEEELQEHYEQEKSLRQQVEEEMKKRVEFTRALAHELKTPLTSVLSSSDLLVSELPDEPLSGLARNIRQGATNLNSRIDELLDIARGEVGMLQLKYESVDLLTLLRETADSMNPLALERAQSLVHVLPPDLPVIQADAVRVQQVVTNLLGNALKFTPRGGKITLRARESSGSVTVEVQDTGRGISKEEREKLFEPYQRLDGDRDSLGGLGLGLYLSKTLVELHGGQIWTKSRVGGGSTFGFTLPVKTKGRRPVEQEQVKKLWKVLIIEDDREIVDSVSLTFRLRWPEAELISAGLGEEGVEMVENEDPDIVILDLGLPDMSGFDVLRQIRLFSSVPVVILTVKGEEADMVKGLEWGADEYVVKPFRQLELLARLKVQLRKQTPPDEEAPIICGPLRLDPSTFQLTHGGKEISLTIVEGRIIEHLMRNAGHVVTHTRLAEAVWGEDYPGAIDSLRVYIRYLRQKLEADPSHPKLILTKAGVGYSLAKPS